MYCWIVSHVLLHPSLFLINVYWYTKIQILKKTKKLSIFFYRHYDGQKIFVNLLLSTLQWHCSILWKSIFLSFHNIPPIHMISWLFLLPPLFPRGRRNVHFRCCWKIETLLPVKIHLKLSWNLILKNQHFSEVTISDIGVYVVTENNIS